MSAEGVPTASEIPLRSVAAAELVAAAALAYAEGYRGYVMCAGVDAGATLEVRHLLRSPDSGAELWLSTTVDASDPRVASVVSVYAGADWFERETYDMFGVLFTGHPDLRRILLPMEWEGFPLRKSYAIDTACPPYRPAPPPKNTLKAVP